MNFAQPGWLALLILLPLLGLGAVLASRLRRRQWQAFVAPRLRAALLKTGSPLPRWLALIGLLAACAAMIAALARPQGDAGTKTETTIGRNVLIALDLSRSMRVADVNPDRLAQAKLVIYEMLDAMPNDRVGLLGFAGSAFLYAPLTIDHAALRETVEQIDETWAPVGGSDLASAVNLATQTLKETGQKNNALVILSDGEQNSGDLDSMIGEAEKSGVYIFAIGVGTENGGFVPDPNFPDGKLVDRSGQQVLSRLQPEVMRRLATETGGRYAAAGSGMDIPAMVTAATAGLDAFEMAGRERKVSVEFYQWLMLPAIVLMMTGIVAGTRWKGMRATAALAALFFIPLPAKADDATNAREALANDQFEAARDSFRKLAENTKPADRKARFRIGEGTAAYRGGDFRGARTAFSQSLLGREPAVLSSGHLGLGNTLFQLGWLGLADEAYPSSPETPPDLERFDTIVRERLAKMLESEAEEGSRSEGFVRMESVVLNWSDAVRHYDSALAADPKNEAAVANGDMAKIYLKRLRELLEQEKQQAEEAMGQPQPGQGSPQEGEGEPGDGEGEGEGEPGEQGAGDENPDDKGGGGDEKDRDGKSGGEESDKDKGKKGAADPNESPEDRARRMLNENSDLEKGPLSPGRREFREPEKDW